MLSKLKFAFISLMAAGLIFCVSKASYAAAQSSWLPTDPATVIVQVIALGAPIEHAEVSVGDASETTGKNGNYVFQVDKGTYTVSCIGPHGGEGSRDVLIGPGEIIQVTFELGAEGLHAAGGH